MFENTSQPFEEVKTYRCPCCRFKTLHGRGGCEICPVCYWEDDGQDDHDADVIRGGANGSLSLQDARANFSEFAAADRVFLAKVRTPLTDEL